MKTNVKTTVYDLSDRYDGFYIEKHQVGDLIEFYLCHKDCSDELPVHDCQSYDEGEAKYYIWANIEEFIEEFNDCEDDD
jgi:hypothetical protein